MDLEARTLYVDGQQIDQMPHVAEREHKTLLLQVHEKNVDVVDNIIWGMRKDPPEDNWLSGELCQETFIASLQPSDICFPSRDSKSGIPVVTPQRLHDLCHNKVELISATPQSDQSVASSI
jgi:hypothetical protein